MSLSEALLCFILGFSVAQTILLLLIALAMLGLFFAKLRDIDLSKLIPEVDGDFEVEGVPIPRRDDLPTRKPRDYGW